MTNCPIHDTHEWLVAHSERTPGGGSLIVYIICRWCREMRVEQYDD